MMQTFIFIFIFIFVFFIFKDMLMYLCVDLSDGRGVHVSVSRLIGFQTMTTLSSWLNFNFCYV